jgi:SAM-dependent methyltransferase
MRPDDVETRTLDDIRRHYEIEVQLANRLRQASRDDRLRLYAEVYDELYRRVPDHPQITRKRTPESTREDLRRQLDFLRLFLKPTDHYLEIGAGDCKLSFEVAKLVRKAYALDVSAEIMKNTGVPENCEMVLSDGRNVPVPPGTIHVAYSNQVMEHLHPDDALDQLRNIHRALCNGGRYVCITPNRLSGPHDVSRYFDRAARGFHLKEYTNAELARLFREAGFRLTVPYARISGGFSTAPAGMPALCEGLLGALPYGLSHALARQMPARWYLGIQLVGIK